MIEVRFFATLREGRGKIVQVPAEEVFTAADLLRRFAIPSEEVAIHGDIISLFPPVGGG